MDAAKWTAKAIQPITTVAEAHISIKLWGFEYHLTVEEAKDLVADIHSKMNALKQRCPTCRCSVLPGEICECCANSKGAPEY